MTLYKVAKTKNSRAHSKHKTYEAGRMAILKIPQPGRYNYSVFKWNVKEQKWE